MTFFVSARQRIVGSSWVDQTSGATLLQAAILSARSSISMLMLRLASHSCECVSGWIADGLQVEGLEAHGITIPLLTTSAGEKVGKSAGNAAVWLCPSRTSHYDFYQYFRSTKVSSRPRP